LRPLAEGIGVRPYACDGGDPESVEALFRRVGDEIGTPRLVVYNAGAYLRSPVLDTEPADFERCWRIVCFGGFLVGRAAGRARLEAGNGGTIISTGATAALRGGAGFVNLAVGKFGLRALSQSMARELGPKGIHVAHVIIDGQIEDATRDG